VNKKNNWDEIAGVFIQTKVWLKRSLGHSEGEWMGRGLCLSRGTGCGGAMAPSGGLQ